MISQKFRCCNRKPSFSIVYSVAGDKKCYDVCSDCINLECFSKYILKKAPVDTNQNKFFQNEFTEEYDESEIIIEQQTEENKINEYFTDESEHVITFAEEQA